MHLVWFCLYFGVNPNLSFNMYFDYNIDGPVLVHKLNFLVENVCDSESANVVDYA